MNKSGIINSPTLLHVRLGYVHFPNWYVFHANLCSLFSFTCCWNVSWMFPEALDFTFQISYSCFPRRKPRSKLLVSEALASTSPWHKALLCWVEEWCPGRAPRLPLRMPRGTWGPSHAKLCPAVDKGTQTKPTSTGGITLMQHIPWGPPSSQGEQGSCKAPGTGEVHPPHRSGFQAFRNDPIPRFDASKQQPVC